MADYLLAYDISSLGDLAPQLQSFVKEHKSITQWSHPFNGLYLLKSPASLPTLIQSFDEFFARRVLHFMSPVDAGQSGGILPVYVWEWLRSPPAPSLGGLLGNYLQQQQP